MKCNFRSIYIFSASSRNSGTFSFVYGGDSYPAATKSLVYSILKIFAEQGKYFLTARKTSEENDMFENFLYSFYATIDNCLMTMSENENFSHLVR